MRNKYLTPKQIAAAIRLRNWCDGEAPPKYRDGIDSIDKMIDNEKTKPTKGTK